MPIIPSYSGGWDQEDCSSRPAWATKSLWDPISIEKTWVWWLMPIIPALMGSINRKIMVQATRAKLQKGLKRWLKQESTCLASAKPRVQTLALPKKCRFLVYLKISEHLATVGLYSHVATICSNHVAAAPSDKVPDSSRHLNLRSWSKQLFTTPIPPSTHIYTLCSFL
jgi:hypothetical protein